MILYHGTNIDFDRIDLKKCRPNKDFGRGFYLTPIKEQAEQMAVRRCEFSGWGAPIIQRYEFEEGLLRDDTLKVKIFNGVSIEWALFILQNREAMGKKVHNYDIVVGPVADDGVVYQMNLYSQHIITVEQLVEGLTYRKLNSQYFFGTKQAISNLKKL